MTVNDINITLEEIQNSINFCKSKIEQVEGIETPTLSEESELYNQIINYLEEYRYYLEFERDWK